MDGKSLPECLGDYFINCLNPEGRSQFKVSHRGDSAGSLKQLVLSFVP